MALAPGTRLGSYEILAAIGRGGMGEVYRAADSRLGRTLAIKVIPAEVAGDAVRRERFEREARAVASLNHPNICILHDVGREGEVDFLVLEYLEAPTLAECLLKGPLPLGHLLRAAIEIADALDHAHRHGVVHRDLKPANIMLAPSGVKVLDFGLARLRGVEALSGLSTVGVGAPPLTGAEEILGTLQYMAPEQLQGREADPRTDIFALGALIYEMATGHRPFEASTRAGTLGAILHRAPPPIQDLQPEMPRGLDRIVARCLEKDAENRWQTARDLKHELEWIASRSASSGRRSSFRAPVALRVTASVAAAALAATAVSLTFVHLRDSAVDRRVVRLSIVPPQTAGDFSLSPDGRFMAFVAGSDEHRLWIHPLDSPTAHPLDGTEGAEWPFWSPDSHFIAFGAGGKLKKIGVAGGAVQTLCDARAVIGGSWNRDGVILFTPNNRTPLYQVAATGGQPVPVTRLDRVRGDNTHRYPQFLPDGRHFLFLARSSRPENNGIYAGSLDSTASIRIVGGDSPVAYAAPGYLFFVRGGALLAQPFDVSSLRMTGEPVQVAQDIRYNSGDSYAAFSVSAHGEIAYQTTAAVPRTQIAWFTRTGQRDEIAGAAGRFSDPSLTRDGTRVAVTRWADGTSDVWVLDAARGTSSRLTLDPAVDYAPLWSPDGRSILFASTREGPSDIYRIASGGGSREAPLVASSAVKHATDWSLDGQLVVYESRDQQTDWDLWTVPAAGVGKAVAFLQTKFAERLGRLAPNGRWMAYVSNESGRDEVYVRGFPASSGKWMISAAGGTEPRWRRDGEELFYVGADHRLMVVPVVTGSQFSQGLPRALFDARLMDDRAWGYDVAPDGKRFIVSFETGPSTPAPIDFVLGWPGGTAR